MMTSTCSANLLAVFGQAFDELDTYTSAQPGTTYLRKLLGGDHFIALAAIEDDAVIGGLAAYELPKFEQARSEIYIYDRPWPRCIAAKVWRLP